MQKQEAFKAKMGELKCLVLKQDKQPGGLGGNMGIWLYLDKLYRKDKEEQGGRRVQ